MGGVFGAIRGQSLAVGLLERALAGRLAGAYLFAGPDGVGKRSTAEALTAALLCRERPPCGACASCTRRLAGAHPDRIEVAVPADRKQIPVSAIRELCARLAYPPHEGLARAVLVPDAEVLSASAANALLKTLEEPPGRTHFLLTTSSPSALLPTIRSRCQIVRFMPLGTADLSAICVEKGRDPAGAALAAALAGGSAARALAAAEAGDLEARRARADAFDGATRGSLGQAMAAAQEVAADKGASLPHTLEILQIFYRDVLVAGAGLDPEHLALGDRQAQVSDRAAGMSRDSVLARLAALDEAIGRLDANASPTLVAEWLALRFRQESA
ncbi:MAG: DNA polymerase III subunit delta' [Deltaproteobacteria bacterium]|nr:DNA polymerase III subunit delta' [Deltaproteobacteria bacterium]